MWPSEWPEVAAEQSLGETLACVLDGDPHRPVMAVSAHGDVALGWRVPDGVVDQVADGLTEPRRIDPDALVRSGEAHPAASSGNERGPAANRLQQLRQRGFQQLDRE